MSSLTLFLMPVVIHRVKDVICTAGFEKSMELLKEKQPEIRNKWDSFISSQIIGFEVKADTEEDALQKLEVHLSNAIDNFTKSAKTDTSPQSWNPDMFDTFKISFSFIEKVEWEVSQVEEG